MDKNEILARSQKENILQDEFGAFVEQKHRRMLTSSF